MLCKKFRKKGVNAAALRLNVGDITRFRHFAQQLQETLRTVWQCDTFDYLLGNAGTGLYAPIPRRQKAQFDEVMNVHLKGPFSDQRLLPVAERWRTDPQRLSGLRTFYTARLRDLCGHEGDGSTDPLSGPRSWRRTRDLRQYHRAGVVKPILAAADVRDDAQQSVACVANRAGRVGLPDDIGDAIAALLSDKLGWMNAQRIEVSGGMFL